MEEGQEGDGRRPVRAPPRRRRRPGGRRQRAPRVGCCLPGLCGGGARIGAEHAGGDGHGAAEASGTRALRRSKSGGKSSKVRPFLPLHCPSKSLSRHSELRFALGAPATWHARGGGSLAGLDAGCRRDGGRLATRLGCFWLELGMDWSNVASPVNHLSPDAVFPWSANFGSLDGCFSLVSPACVQHFCMHLIF